MEKEYRLILSLQLMELPRPIPIDDEDTIQTSADPVERDREEIDASRKFLDLASKCLKAGTFPGAATPPAYCSVTQTFDVLAESFEDAQKKLSAFQDLAHQIGLPSRAGKNIPFSTSIPFMGGQ